MKYWKAPRLLLTLGLILFLSLLLGCSQGTSALTPKDTAPRVRLTLIPREENLNISEQFHSEDLGGNYGGTLTYKRLSGVTIEHNGKTEPVEEAVKSGALTLEELESWARMDTREGLCWMRNDTENGLTCFQYRYDDYILDVIDDVYETPDGKQHLIQRFTIRAPNTPSEALGGYSIEQEGGSFYTSFIDQEDWGLIFDVIETSPNSITIKSTQSGGQQFGTLSVYKYELIDYEHDQIYRSEADDTTAQMLQMEGSSAFDIGWEDWTGAVSSGKYMLRLFVEDIYTEDQIPPMSRNFTDYQVYEIDFTIQ